MSNDDSNQKQSSVEDTKEMKPVRKRTTKAASQQIQSDASSLALENKLNQVVVSVNEYQETAKIAIDEIRHERYWRRIVAFLMGVGAIFVMVVGVVLFIQSRNINRTTSSTNSIASDVKSNQKLIADQQQRSIDGQQAATKLVNDALQAISDNNQAQLDQLRKDLQELAIMLQRGQTIPPVSTGTTTTSIVQTTIPVPSTSDPPAVTTSATTTTTVPQGLVCRLPVLNVLC